MLKIGRFLFILTSLFACHSSQSSEQNIIYERTGKILRYAPALDELIDPSTRAEILAEGFVWSEGPLWLEREQMLLFSDVPANTIYQWTAQGGPAIYLRPSGYTGAAPSKSREPGSNGLLLDNKGSLVLCQHGNRQVARMDAPLHNPQAIFKTIANQYNKQRLSSPNDAVYNRKGELFFTDPPYGLPTQRDDDPEKEIPFNGVYKVTQSGEVILLTDKISKPNGIALFPGEEKLLVGSSDPHAAHWYSLDLTEPTATPAVFYDATPEREGPGLPDGLKITSKGIVYASGPGGVWIFDRTGRALGKIVLDKAASNVALSADERTLYITNSDKLLRVKLK